MPPRGKITRHDMTNLREEAFKERKQSLLESVGYKEESLFAKIKRKLGAWRHASK